MIRRSQLALARSTTFALTLVSLLGLALALVRTSEAAGVVGPPCNMSTLGAAMNSGSGDITFNCGGPATIVITQPGGLNVLPGQTFRIHGGDVITLRGSPLNRIFNVQAGGALTLSHILLTGGNDANGGAISLSDARLVLDRVTVQNSTGNGFPGGAVYANGGRVVLMNNSLVQGNRSYDRGAIFATGELVIADSVLRDNVATAEGGALYVNGKATIQHSQIYTNSADAHGGALAIVGGAQVTITDSAVMDNLAGRFSNGLGGGIYITGSSVVSMSKTDLSGNVVNGPSGYPYGGAIFNGKGQLTVSGSRLNRNATTGLFLGAYGGAIYNAGSVTVTQSTLNANTAGFGGGLYNDGTAILSEDTLSLNTAGGDGGGIGNQGTVLLTNVTLSTNSADTDGGGIWNYGGAATFLNVTVNGNQSGNGGGGIAHYSSTTGKFLSLRNTIVANSPRGGNCSLQNGVPVPMVSNDHNLSNDNSCAFALNKPNDLNGVAFDPLLADLAANGGPTLTHMPRPPSPAIDGGTNFGCPLTDQRGAPRPVDGDRDSITTCDIGAVEYGGLLPWLWLPLVRR